MRLGAQAGDDVAPLRRVHDLARELEAERAETCVRGRHAELDMEEAALVLLFEARQETAEPFERILIAIEPNEVHVLRHGPRSALFLAQNEALEHARKRRHADPGANEHDEA